jgi:hypothetical protein
MLPALDLDNVLNQKLNADLGGHHVPRLAFFVALTPVELQIPPIIK